MVGSRVPGRDLGALSSASHSRIILKALIPRPHPAEIAVKLLWGGACTPMGGKAPR